MSKQMLSNAVTFINKHGIQILLLVALCMFNSGCASILNPYEENFSCADNPKGKCITITGAYEESTHNKISLDMPDGVERVKDPAQAKKESGKSAPSASGVKVNDECKGDKDCIAKEVSARVTAEIEARYQNATQNKMARMLKEPITPLVAPPTVLRVLILPYQDDESGLNLMRYTYIMVDKPKWIMGDYLNEGVTPQ